MLPVMMEELERKVKMAGTVCVSLAYWTTDIVFPDMSEVCWERRYLDRTIPAGQS